MWWKIIPILGFFTVLSTVCEITDLSKINQIIMTASNLLSRNSKAIGARKKNVTFRNQCRDPKDLKECHNQTRSCAIVQQSEDTLITNAGCKMRRHIRDIDDGTRAIEIIDHFKHQMSLEKCPNCIPCFPVTAPPEEESAPIATTKTLAPSVGPGTSKLARDSQGNVISLGSEPVETIAEAETCETVAPAIVPGRRSYIQLQWIFPEAVEYLQDLEYARLNRGILLRLWDKLRSFVPEIN